MKVYKVYTDGACSGNPGPGGWGVVIVYNNQIDKLDGSDPQTTNNRMELLAAIKGIKETPTNSEVLLYTDSKYVKDGITIWINRWEKNDWKTSSKKPVKLFPCMSLGILFPAKSRIVGAKSTFDIISSFIVPGLIFFGYLIKKGICNDSSYINLLSYIPCSPR